MGFVDQLKSSKVLHMVLGITFICSGLFLNLLQVLLFITIRPFSKPLFRTINYYLLYSSWSQLVCLAEWWSSTELKFHCTPEDYAQIGKEHALLIMNHNYEIEWLMGWIVGERFDVLGNCRVYAKKVLKYLPVIGWSWFMSDVIFVERDWNKDSKNLITSLNELYSYQRKVWVLIFCEGTRFTKEKHEASLKFAKERGLPLLKHHLLPRTKGFVFSVKHLKGKFPALYDITIGFSKEHAEPSLRNLLYGRKIQASLYVRRILLDDIPTSSEEECSKYLYNIYAEKDEILGEFLSTGKFPCKQIALDRRPFSLLNFLVWVSLTVSCILFIFYSTFVYGSTLQITLMLLTITSFYFAINKLMNLTKASKGSDYGKKR